MYTCMVLFIVPQYTNPIGQDHAKISTIATSSGHFGWFRRLCWLHWRSGVSCGCRWYQKCPVCGQYGYKWNWGEVCDRQSHSLSLFASRVIYRSTKDISRMWFSFHVMGKTPIGCPLHNSRQSFGIIESLIKYSNRAPCSVIIKSPVAESIPPQVALQLQLQRSKGRAALL